MSQFTQMNKLKLEAATIATDEQPTKKRIIVVIDGLGGVDYHRTAMPFAYIKEKGIFDVDFAITEKEIQAVKIENYDILVYSRYLLDMSLLQKAIDKGLKVVVDIDDYWNVPKYNPAYKVYKEKGKRFVLESLKVAHQVWTTTNQLAWNVAQINKNVYVLPNYIDTDEPQWNDKNEHPLTIGYVGGFSHLEDVKLLRDQIGPVCEKYNARFLLCGYNHLDPLSMEMEYQITGTKERPNWFWVGENTSVINYGKYYSHMDIAIAPLTSTTFNRFKSELKIVEAAAYNLPCVVSDVEPYTNHSDNEGVVFVKNNQWTKTLSQLIESGQAKELGKKNAEYCKIHHNMHRINEKRIKLLSEL